MTFVFLRYGMDGIVPNDFFICMGSGGIMSV
jgi:hypothetical protein